MNRYLKALRNEANLKRTLNGAVTHATTGEANLDLFSVAGGMRYRKPMDQIHLMDRAYIENPELAMKLLFYIRDIRGGMGERRTFRSLLRHVAQAWPESAIKNVRHIPEYGRFDDLFCLMGTRAEKEVIRVVKEQLEADLAALERRNGGDMDAHISLLAKWMPSSNTSSEKTRRCAQKLMQYLEMDPKTYRKTLSRLRAATSVTERKLSAGKVARTTYRAVPGGAMLKYRNAFLKKDRERYLRYLDDVTGKRDTIHSKTLFPYEIIRPIIGDDCWEPIRMSSDDLQLKVLEALWKALPSADDTPNALCVVDTSGSMYWKMHPEAVTPALISQALGLYYAERCVGAFHNCFITFESTPHLMEVKGNNLADKLRYIQSAPWGGSTNLEAVFDLILRTAVSRGIPQEEMPSVLYIISDMEFNAAFRNPGMTLFDNACESFRYSGYELPAIVFINVNSWQMQAPVKAHTKGAALASGAGVSTFQHKFDGNVTPMSHMLRVLNGARYARIHA